MKLSINIMWLLGKLNTVIIFITVANVTSKDFRVSTNWKVIEALAENHPYIVGLLNRTKDYVCTGTIIDYRTVLTSGNCIKAKPSFIAVGASVISRDISTKNLFQIASVILHTDYVCEVKELEPNVTQMHSNIGVVFSLQPDLEFYTERVAFGNFYASELKDQKLTVIGYGKINNSNAVVLQQQNYLQMPCANPKWYYCVCGIEYTTHMNNFRDPFGQGAPVIFNSELVGVTAYPCRGLSLPAVNFHYNIFTVVAPYMRWIRNNQNETGTIQLRARNNANYQRELLCDTCIIAFGATEIVTYLITMILFT